MYLLYCFLAYLSLSLYNASKNVGEQTGDLTIAHSYIGLTMFFFVIGGILPFITMFFFIEWYWAILINIGLLLISMVVANFLTSSSSVLTSLIAGGISLILFLTLLF